MSVKTQESITGPSLAHLSVLQATGEAEKAKSEAEKVKAEAEKKISAELIRKLTSEVAGKMRQLEALSNKLEEGGSGSG